MVRNEAVLPVAQFLGRAWSGKPQLQVQLTYSDPPVAGIDDRGYYIGIPPPSRFPTTGLISAYRLWRATLWHEAMHHNYGIPRAMTQHNNKFIILNTVEDYRIERLGVREYPGMKRELELRCAVYYHLAREPTDNVGAYIQLLLLGAVKSVNIPHCVVEAARYTRDAVEQGVDSVTIAEQVCKILNVQPMDYCYKPSPIQYTVPQDKKIKAGELKRTVEEWLEASQRVQSEFGESTTGEQADVTDKAEKILTAPDEVKEELEQIMVEDKRIEHGRKGAVAEVAENIMLPSKLDVDESRYYDQELITRLKSQLQKLRKGWKEISSHTGEFDVDSYVSRHNKVFTDEERLKVGGYKVLILIDHSASIGGYDVKYKKACIALAEGLSVLKIPFAIYVFTEYGPYSQIYLIKSFDERWTRMNAKRLAQLQPGGGTPLADVYARLMPYVRRNKGKLYFITLTDGEPSNAFYCKQLIQTLKRHCKMFAVAFEDSMVGAVRLAFNLQTLGYERYVALDDVKKLPEKVLGLLGE